MSEKQYDLVVLGGGTAGYVAAIRASQLGKKVAIVEKSLLGGTCLHKGCIPTKALLKSAEVLRTVKESADFGVNIDHFSFDLKTMMERKDNIVSQMHQGIDSLMQKNHIDVFNGTGRIMGTSIFSPQSGTISVEYEDGESDLLPNQYVLIATGSYPTQLPFLPFNHETVLSSSDMLELTDLPSKIAIIGGGVIGLEFASLLIDLGVEVSVIEAGERILPAESAQIAKYLKTALSERGVAFYENCALSDTSVTVNTNSVTIQVNEEKTLELDKVLVAIGRTPNTNDIGLNNTKIQTDQLGNILVNDCLQTEDKHIYAAGDCIGKLQLAHVSSKEGILAVEHMFNGSSLPLNYNKMPKCIYTHPEVASIGYNKESAKAQNIKSKSFKVGFNAIGKAVIETNAKDKGFCEMVIDQETNEIIGISMIGPQVTELINEASLLQFMNGSAIELALTTHAHPSISEVLMELGLKVENRAIHV
ncbi:dihydrolipoyl dehydrogenase [Staphylococcus sp. HMSC34C02]|uniref:dihydrolipoyl dehydrogenase n=1 Tax=Staphylococcus sp. HMSC34C02 TaxID=1608858 RepID=UPI0008A9159D|nr:dihydrolipoyl dehydrogenase [Staphylococcus sp. HMSC34C02]OHR84929.1 dihydrolipoyl dehydrogenase [Staphylococcus sp. HMSC34C02]